MTRNIFLLAIAMALSACASTPRTGNSIVGVRVQLPPTMQWVEVTDKSAGDQYIHEWIPRGSTVDGAKWIISVQRLDLHRDFSSKGYIKAVFSLARNECTDVIYGELQKIMVKGHATYAGRFMYAQQKGKDYGTFTDQRVATQDRAVFVVTSELHVPKSSKAGVLAFGKNQLPEIKAFMKRQKESENLVRNAVIFCFAGGAGC